MVKLLNVETPENDCWPDVPLKLVVPLLVMVPLLVRFPEIFKVPAAAVVKVAPELIVRLLLLTLVVITGILTAPEGIITSVVAVGAIPLHQLFGFDQSELTLPVH